MHSSGGREDESKGYVVSNSRARFRGISKWVDGVHCGAPGASCVSAPESFFRVVFVSIRSYVCVLCRCCVWVCMASHQLNLTRRNIFSSSDISFRHLKSTFCPLLFSPAVTTGSSKKKVAKSSAKFCAGQLAGGGWPSLDFLAERGREFSNREHFFCTSPADFRYRGAP